MKIPLFLALLALASPAGAWPIMWDPSMWNVGNQPDYLKDDFMGPRTEEQQKQYDAAKLAGQQSALSVGNSCVPWHPPCKLPEEAKAEDILKEGNTVNEDGWVKTADGYLTPTGELIKKTDPRYRNLAPVKAEEEQKRIAENQKRAAREYSDANSRMWNGNAGGTGGGVSILSNSPTGGSGAQARTGNGTPNVEGTAGGVTAVADNGGVEPLGLDVDGMIDDVLANQPDGSALWNGDARSGYGDGNTGLGAGLNNVGALMNPTDNGNAVSMTSGGGGSRGPAPGKTSSIGQLHKSARPKEKGFFSAIGDWLEHGKTWDNMEAGSAPRVEENPAYKQTAAFGIQPSKNGQGPAEY